ncbi:chemotaxis protein [Massilia horti]|uniref:Chemotaxis protein n=1 Tax=Massilia horti TaxID=2562153 RepID=A0A4Y9T7X7_9BURK|nr:chemotaxis protein [Massilia horti]
MNAREGLAVELAVEELEIELLLEAVFQRYGFDFRDYERAAVRHKLHAVMAASELATVSTLQERVLHEPGAASRLLRALSVAPSALFDDPEHTRLLRNVLGTSLRASPLPKVWLPECAGIGQAWTLAIVLAEEDLYARTEIHATLANDELVAEMREASLPYDELAALQENYAQSGGNGNLTEYFEVNNGQASLLPRLKSRITWSEYNLVTDASFNEFNAIICRRALLDFGPVLRQRALRLFHDSLARFGVLGLDCELPASDSLAENYQPIFPNLPWYKRIG